MFTKYLVSYLLTYLWLCVCTGKQSLFACDFSKT